MSMSLLVEVTNAAVPLDVTIVKEGAVLGGAPTVAVRDGATSNSYLDWSDLNFKTSGWTLKYAGLVEVERGHYQRLLDLSSIPGLAAGGALIAEFAIADGGHTWTDHDVLLLTNTGGNTDLLRKMITNRFEETPGNPGTITLFDDDSMTPLLSWQIRDAAGGGVVSNVGAPARRTKAT
jgi:hypothetical protein